MGGVAAARGDHRLLVGVRQEAVQALAVRAPPPHGRRPQPPRPGPEHAVCSTDRVHSHQAKIPCSWDQRSWKAVSFSTIVSTQACTTEAQRAASEAFRTVLQGHAAGSGGAHLAAGAGE